MCTMKVGVRGGPLCTKGKWYSTLVVKVFLSKSQSYHSSTNPSSLNPLSK